MNKKIILGIIAVVIIAIVGGVYFVTNKKSNQVDLLMSEYVAGNYLVKYPSSLIPFYSFCNVGGVNGTDVKIEKIMFWFKDSTPVLPISNECPMKLENSAPIVVNLDDPNIVITDTTNNKYSEIAKQISIKSTIVNSTKTSTSDWKTYTNTKDGYTFDYPTTLSLSTSIDGVNLTHSVPFENTDGGCDMVGNGKVSKTLGDFNVLISVAPGQIKPSYVDGTFSRGSLNGDWAYKGAEGCGQTVYYFPISGNRTLIVTKQELQILSPVVAPDVRNKVLAVPGVISYEESNRILEEMLSTFKFTN